MLGRIIYAEFISASLAISEDPETSSGLRLRTCTAIHHLHLQDLLLSAL